MNSDTQSIETNQIIYLANVRLGKLKLTEILVDPVNSYQMAQAFSYPPKNHL